MLKYKLIGRAKIEYVDGKPIKTYKIQALSTFTNKQTGIVIKEGEIGGRISKDALSQNGTCWVDEGSVVALTEEYPRIAEDAFISYSEVFGNIYINDNAIVSYSKLRNNRKNYMEIVDDARVVNSTLIGNVKVGNSAQLGDCFVSGQVTIDGKSFLENCTVKNQSVNSENFITVRLSGKEQSDYTLVDREIIDTDYIVNDVKKETRGRKRKSSSQKEYEKAIKRIIEPKSL